MADGLRFMLRLPRAWYFLAFPALPAAVAGPAGPAPAPVVP